MIELPEQCKNIAAENGFEVKGYRFTAKQEELRQPRVIRVGAIQNAIVLPTTESVPKQREAIWEKIKTMIKAAAAADVNIVCMQEAWSEFRLISFFFRRLFNELSVNSHALCLLYS